MEIRLFNPTTGEITVEEVPDVIPNVEELRSQKLIQLMELYKSAITIGFYSSATGDKVMYGYSQQDQLNYSKWANVFALNPSRESVIIGSISNGVVTMTREQFTQFIADAENYEVTMYLQRKDIEEQINGASTIDELNSIIITF
jgi:hypothetical protein